MSGLNPYQKRCVTEDGHLLITACPGSGKTTVLSHRSERLLVENPAATLMAVTFTKDAAEELRERILKRVPDAKNRLATGTFHSLALKQLKRAGFNRKIISDHEAKEMINTAIERANVAEELKAFDVLSTFNSIQSAVEPDNHPIVQTNAVYRELWFIYKSMKEQAEVIDFSDILHFSVRMMKSGEIQPFAATYVLGDEAQDMDEVQHEWINFHARNGSLVTLVGDDDQSVYGFRYASGYEGMRKFLRDLQATQVVLPVNYRCGADILAKAATLIENNIQRVDKPIEAGMDYPGEILSPIIGLLDDKGSRKEEYERVINFLMEDHFVSKRKVTEWAVLARGNFALADFERVCYENGIENHRESGTIWDARFARLFIGILNYIVDREWFGMALFLNTYMESDNLFVSRDMDLHRLYEMELEGSPANAENLKALLYYEQQWREWLAAGDKESVDKLIQDVSQFLMANIDLIPRMSDKSRESACNVVEVCAQILMRRTEDLKRRIFMETSPLIKKGDRKTRKLKTVEEKGGLFINLMTMHASKGLEFDNVFLIGCDDSAMLKDDASSGLPNVQEERRLFYVAMTRARHRLGFSVCSSDPSKLQSQFLTEIGFK
jgi:superfamily I DNA/RNA helicase